MATLNRFWNYIDPNTKDGDLLTKTATINFKSSVDNVFPLTPNKLEEERFISTIKDLLRAFGCDYLVKTVPSMCVKTVVAANNGTQTTTISYSKHINLFDVFSPDNLDMFQKAASLTYGDQSFSTY